MLQTIHCVVVEEFQVYALLGDREVAQVVLV